MAAPEKCNHDHNVRNAKGEPTGSAPCEFEFAGTNATGVRSWFCKSHQLWAYTFPTSLTYGYEDGTTYEKSVR